MEKTEIGTNKLNGFYRGTVKEVGKFGQCKIFWHGVSPNVWLENPEMLPWSEQASPLFASANNTDGLFFYPDIGTTVWGFFQDGDANYPVYFASCIGVGSNNSCFEETAANDKSTMKGKKAKRTAILSLGELRITYNGCKISSSDAENEDADDEENSPLPSFYKIECPGSVIDITENGINISSIGNISISGKNVEIKATNKTSVVGESILALESSGTDENNKFRPGQIYVVSNNNIIRSTGGRTTIAGDMEAVAVE